MLTIWMRLKFPGMFFASGVVIPEGGGDGGAGDLGGGAGGDEGDAGGGGDEGDEVQDLGEGDEGGDGDEGHEADEGDEGEIDPDTGKPKVATKPRTPEEQNLAVKNALNKLRKTDPALADTLRKQWGENGEFKKLFPTLTAAREASELIENSGGVEGIQTNRQKADDYAAELTNFADGNPASIDMMARDFPEGLAKLTPYALQKMAEIRPQAYERTMAKEMAGIMDRKGFTHLCERALELHGDGKTEAVGQLLTRIRQWITNTEAFGKSQPAAGEGGEVSEVEKGRKEVAEGKAAIRMEKVTSATTKSMNGIISNNLSGYLRNTSLKLPQKQILATRVYTKICDNLKANAGYQSRLQSLMKSGTPEEIARFVGSHTKRVAPAAVKAAWSELGYGNLKRSGAPKPKLGADGKPIAAGAAGPTFGKKPKAEEIDWSKDRDKMRYMSGEATLLNGKVRKWDPKTWE